MGDLSRQDFFRKNPFLKQVGVTMAFTPDQKREWIKCRKDPIYFIETYVSVLDADGNKVPCILRPYQRKIVDGMHKNRKVIVMAARQSGKTTVVAAFFIWYILFHKTKTVAIMANKQDTAKELMNRAAFCYMSLPKWLQQGVQEWNKMSIWLENGSRLVSAATSVDALRSFTINILYLDEFAHIQNNLAEDFFTSVYPTLSQGKNTKIFITSTPKGMNHFYRMWKSAEAGKNGFVPIIVHWTEVPGRDEKWMRDQIETLGPVKFEQEHNLAFLGSSNTLISAGKLRNMVERNPIREEGGFRYWKDPIIEKRTEDGKLVQRPHIYVACVDVAEGQGQDYSTIQMIDVTYLPYEVVATFRRNDISPLLFPTIIWEFANRYNSAYVLLEISTIGLQVGDLLHFDIAYENLIKITAKGKLGQQISQGYQSKGKMQTGLKQSKATKRIGCANLKTLIEMDKLVTYDSQTIGEMTTFIASQESFAAEQGYHDDLVMGLVIFSWLMAQRYFKDAVDMNIREILQKEYLNLEDDDIVPFVVDDGVDDAEREKEEAQTEREELYQEHRRQYYPFDGDSWDLDFDRALRA